MSDTATSVSDAITPANILDPVTIPVPGAEKPATAQPEAAPAEDADKPGTADEAASEDKDDPKRKAKARIGELYAQKKAAERQAQASVHEAMQLRRELDAIRRNTNPDDWQQVQRADIKSAVKEERLSQLETDAQQRFIESQALRQKGWESKIEAARERIPDMDQAIETFAKLPVSDYAADIISESDKAAEITYFLARNPSEAHRIANLPPHQQGRELARIEAKVSPGQARRTSNAPPPVPIIGTNTAPSTPAVRDMGVADIGKLLGYGAK